MKVGEVGTRTGDRDEPSPGRVQAWRKALPFSRPRAGSRHATALPKSLRATQITRKHNSSQASTNNRITEINDRMRNSVRSSRCRHGRFIQRWLPPEKTGDWRHRRSARRQAARTRLTTLVSARRFPPSAGPSRPVRLRTVPTVTDIPPPNHGPGRPPPPPRASVVAPAAAHLCDLPPSLGTYPRKSASRAGQPRAPRGISCSRASARRSRARIRPPPPLFSKRSDGRFPGRSRRDAFFGRPHSPRPCKNG